MKRIENMLNLAGVGAGEAVLIHKPSNIFYLSGYTGEGILAAGRGFGAIITDFRYTEQAEHQAPGFDVLMVSKGVSHPMLAAKVFADHGVKSVLYEDDEVTVKAFEKLRQEIPGVEFSPLNGAPEKARRIKDEGEIRLMEEACDISCRALDAVLGKIKPGMTEKQLQLLLDYTMLELGADALAFNTIVASGVNGSLPHAIPSDKKLEIGEMITMDFGAKKGGYCADMTRTVALGQPSAEMKKIYDTVLLAQETCEAMLAPGKNCFDIDTEAHRIIDGAGYAGRFGHGLGHSVGIDIHENPRLSQLCHDILECGTTITVEPGIYVPGLGGVRIENTCVVTEHGARTLVHAQKALLIL
ncbi:MAG: aminopeptidase P family protein [Clostridia bacterium]|nr:aminopeptidase P family protein [Clostridia bacterium]